ncbi:hypothetical protein [Sphaerothrix gracilis]|uniref:hypothetical protein n=1 Tax=Sphaerothrix gracilis TaxID=3151835 RepID=UPI0031FBDC10
MISGQQPPRVAPPRHASNYQTQLHPWCIIRHLPKSQCITVARLRRRNDAEAHLRVLRRLIPQAQFTLLFDPHNPVTGSSLEALS